MNAGNSMDPISWIQQQLGNAWQNLPNFWGTTTPEAQQTEPEVLREEATSEQNLPSPGTQNQNSQSDAQNQNAIATTHDPKAKTGAVAEKSIPVERPEELTVALFLLRCDTMRYCEEKLKKRYEKTQSIARDQQILHDIQRKIMAQAKDDGTCDLTALRNTPEWKELSQKAQGITINLPDKDILSKEEKDLYLRILENRDKDYDRDLKLCMQETQQFVQEKNQAYAELKSLWDKHSDILKKIMQNIPSR